MGVKQTTHNKRSKCSRRYARLRYLTCPYSLSDLTEHEVRCKEVLTGLMVPFGQGPSDVYGCPLISWTEPNKTSVEGIIILHDWWKKEDCKDPASKPLEGSSYTMEDALIYIDQVIAGF